MSPARQQLSQREIDYVLGHYELGAVHGISELAAGSVYSPKVIVESDRGKLLLKRRARGLDIPAVVAFSHEVILGSLDRGVCVPPLLATKSTNSMVQFEDQVYELFVFIDGVMFDRSSTMIGVHSEQAGALLGEVHTALDEIRTNFEPAVEPETIDLSRLSILERQQSQPGGIDDATRHRLGRLLEYGSELAKANARPAALVHGDWHPGNMIYRGAEIVAVCDFDNTRVGSRVREVAQAMIHFSLKAPTRGQTPMDCDPDPEMNALHRFWRGYVSSAKVPCSGKVCAGLMAPVMIDEALAAFPSRLNDGTGGASNAMLIAASRKAGWLDEHQSELLSNMPES